MTVVTSKGPDAFRTISEASDELGVPTHILRFWETKFSFIRPMKRAGGRRFYRPRDLDVLKGVRALLHEEGYTIKGVQRLHKEQGLRRLLAASGAEVAALTDAELESGLGEASEATDAIDAPLLRALASSITAEAGLATPVEEPRRLRPILTQTARARLEAVLNDLDGARGAIDAALREKANDVD